MILYILGSYLFGIWVGYTYKELILGRIEIVKQKYKELKRWKK